MDRIYIMPFTTNDGISTFRDSEIADFYTRVIKEGWGDIVFYDGSIQNSAQFVELMKSDTNALHIVYYKGLPAAMVWLNRFEQTHAYVHWTFFRSVMGTPALKEIGTAVINFMFNNYKLEVLMGITPSFNKLALRFLKSIGLRSSCEIPGILWNEKKVKAIPGHIMFINREDVK